MSDLFETIKNAVSGAADAAKDIAESVSEKARSIAGETGEAAKTVSRIAKLKVDISAEKAKANDAYLEIGKLFFEKADKLNIDPDYSRLFDQVLLANSNVETMEAEMKELRAQFETSGDEAETADFEQVVAEAESECCCENDTDCCCDDGSIEVEITEEPEDKSEE